MNRSSCHKTKLIYYLEASDYLETGFPELRDKRISKANTQPGSNTLGDDAGVLPGQVHFRITFYSQAAQQVRTDFNGQRSCFQSSHGPIENGLHPVSFDLRLGLF